jgi:formylmethanofuran dehydrogenase subunit B
MNCGIGLKTAAKTRALKNVMLFLKDKNGQTAWHMAAGRNHVEIITKL